MQSSQVNPTSNALRKRNLYVDALVLLFGISSWIGVNSSYLQMPLIVSTAPEGWALPSYMTIVVQSSNIFSFAYVAYQKFARKKLNDGHLIIATMTMGCASAIGMAFLYGNTMKINGTEHSVAYLIFTFLFATVGTVSSVLFLPYMGRFRECYLVTYMCGQGANGLLSTFMALIQGVGGAQECIPNTNATDGPAYIPYLPTPNFGTKIFFLFVFSVLVVCTTAFILLNSLDVCKKEHASGSALDGNEYYYNSEDRHDIATGEIPDNVINLSTFNYWKLIFALFLIGFFGNGIFPGLMSFSALPYGFMAYHLAVTLANVGNATGSLIAQFIPHTSICILDAMVALTVVTGAYIFYVATQSPKPPFQNTNFGCISIVSSFIYCFLLNFNSIFFWFYEIGFTVDCFHWGSKLHENIDCCHFPVSRRQIVSVSGIGQFNLLSSRFSSELFCCKLYNNICRIETML